MKLYTSLAVMLCYAAAGAAGAKPTATAAPTNTTPNAPTDTPVKKAKPEFKVIGISNSVPMPTVTKGRGGNDAFDWQALEVGMSIALSGRDATSLRSTISSANKRARENPFPALNPQNGVPAMYVKVFQAFDCGADDPDGATCRIFRMPNKEHKHVPPAVNTASFGGAPSMLIPPTV